MSTSEDMDMAENDSSVMNVKQTPNQSMHVGLDRYSRLNIVLKNVLERISSGVSEDAYASVLSRLPALSKSKSAPGKMHKKMKTNLFESLSKELECMLIDENMEEKYKKLDELIDESAIHEGENTWRPNGNVNDHVRSHVMVAKLKQNRLLEECIREKERRTLMLQKKVSEERAKVRLLQEKLEHLKDQSSECTVLDRIDKKILDKAMQF